MKGMIAWWARNPVAANLLMIGIIISGLLAFFAMEREVWQTIRVNWVQVSVAWPGAAPQEVEEQLIVRIEEAVSDLDNIERIRSFAAEGMGEVYIEGNAKLDFGQFLNDVKGRIDGISSFPRDIEKPQVRELLTRDNVISIAVHGDVSEKVLKQAAEQARDEVALKPGISIVELFGARREEVSIELSEEAMQRYGLTFDEVASAVRGTSINLSSGTVRTETGDIMLRARNLANTETDFGRIVVRQTVDGGTILLRDVANIVDGFDDNEILATFDGQPAVLVQVMTSETMNVVQTAESVQEWLEESKDRMPEGVTATLWRDSSKIYFDRMKTIGGSAGYGLILVFIVLLLSLRPKVAFWVTLGIGVAFAGAFIFLPANDVSLNLLSTFAFLLVLGVIVDDAIVVGESIHRESMISGGGLDAAVLGTQLVAKPVVFAVLTTMIAFLPWMFLSGVDVQFTRQISIVIIAALSFSLIEALFILPAHLAKMKPREHLGRLGTIQKSIANSITWFAQGPYKVFVEKALERRYLTTSIFVAVLIFSVGLTSSGWLKFSFMPEVESEEIMINVTMPDGAPYSRALEILDQLQVAQRKLEAEVNQRAAESGDGEGRLIENWYTRSRKDSVLAIVQLAPSEVRQMSSKEAAERLRELIGDIPDAQEVQVRFTLNDNSPDIQYSVSSESLEDLRVATDALKDKLHSFNAIYDISDNLSSSTDEIRLHLKPGAEKLGLTLGEVSRQVRQAFYGEEVQRLPREDGDVKVMVRYPSEVRKTLYSLSDFRVRLSDGREVPLMAVVDVEFAPGLKRIERWERRRAAVVSARVKGDARGEIMEDMKENFFPEWDAQFPTVSRGEVGQAEGEAQFMREVLSLSVVALFAMYSLIGIAFRSYWEPLIIMTAIPFGFMGAVYGHVGMGATITLFSYFGVAAAAGVVVNDNLVLVDYMNRLRAKGMEALPSIVEAGVSRFRPIVITSLTTFVGLVPMLAERSTQAEFLKPAAISLAFGVLFATTVTLALVPALYGIGYDMSRLSARIKGWFKAKWIATVGKIPSPAQTTIPPGE